MTTKQPNCQTGANRMSVLGEGRGRFLEIFGSLAFFCRGPRGVSAEKIQTDKMIFLLFNH